MNAAFASTRPNQAAGLRTVAVLASCRSGMLAASTSAPEFGSVSIERTVAVMGLGYAMPFIASGLHQKSVDQKSDRGNWKQANRVGIRGGRMKLN